MPLIGQMLQGPLPYYPSLPIAIESEQEEIVASNVQLDTISELQEPQQRGVIRPLGRTQSSPLPLGHTMLGQPPIPAQQTTSPIQITRLPEPSELEQEQRDMELRSNDTRR